MVQVDTIFVSGMNPELTEDEIAQHFGSIGVIKVSFKVNICVPTLFYLNLSFAVG